MSSANGYDQGLLAAAPKPTKAERQEGYNVDLLEEGSRTAPVAHSTDLEHGNKEAYPISKDSEPPIPFYRTKKGKIIIAVVVAIVVIAAAVGGGVGASKKSNKSDTSFQAVGSADGKSSTVVPPASQAPGTTLGTQAAGTTDVKPTTPGAASTAGQAGGSPTESSLSIPFTFPPTLFPVLPTQFKAN